MVFVFSVQTTLIKPSYLAPGQIVGGVPYSQLKQPPVQIEKKLGKLETLEGIDWSFLFSTSARLFPALFPLLLLCGCPSNKLSSQNNPTQTNNSPQTNIPGGNQTTPNSGETPLNIQTVPENRVPQETQIIPLDLALLSATFYGNTTGASNSHDDYIVLNQNRQRSENWGNVLIQIRHQFSSLLRQVELNNIETIQFQASGQGRINVWLKTVQDHDAGQHGPVLPLQTFQITAGQTETIQIDLAHILNAVNRRGGIHAIVIDRLSGSVRVENFQIRTKRPVSLAQMQQVSGPISVFNVVDVLGQQVSYGRRIRREIEQGQWTVPRFDSRLDIRWMMQNQNSRTGLIKDTDVHSISPNYFSAWSYAQGTALMRLAEEGELVAARRLARGLIRLQNRTGDLRGSWPRGWQWENGTPINSEAGIGESAWIAFGFFNLYLATGESEWLDPLYEAVHFIAQGQKLNRSNMRVFGSVHRTYDASGVLFPWISIEHNIDAASLFYKVAHLQLPRADVTRLQGKGIYYPRLQLYARSRLIVDWMVRDAAQGGMWTGERFKIGHGNQQGTAPSDSDEPTDPQTWGILSLDAVEEIHPHALSNYQSALDWILAYTKMSSWNGSAVYGFSRKPFSRTPSISSEFTYGFALAAQAQNQTGLYRFFTANALRLRDPQNQIPLSILGPEDKNFPFRETFGHVTAANWAVWAVRGQNPFDMPVSFRSHSSVVLQTRYPEEATLQTQVRLISGGSSTSGEKKRVRPGKQFKQNKKDPKSEKLKKKKVNGGFIGRGPMASSYSAELIIHRWTEFLPDNERRQIDDFFQLSRTAVKEFENIISLIEARMATPGYFSDFERLIAAQLLDLVRNFSGYIIPFNSSTGNAKNFMASFASRNLAYQFLGFNVSFLEFLKRENQPELITEVFMHEFLHLAIEDAANEDSREMSHEEIHQHARLFQALVMNPDIVHSEAYIRKNKARRAGFWRQMVETKVTPLNQAIVKYLERVEAVQKGEIKDPLIEKEIANTYKNRGPRALSIKDLSEFSSLLMQSSL